MQCFEQFLDGQRAPRRAQLLGHGHRSTLVTGTVVADQALEGQERIAPQKHAGKLPGTHPAIRLHSPEQRIGNEGKDDADDKEERVGVQVDDPPLALHPRRQIDQPAAHQLAQGAGDARPGIVESHVRRILFRGHYANNQ